MKRTTIAAVAACALLGLGAGSAAAKPAPAPEGDAPGAVQLTSGTTYDRNPSVVQDGKTTWLFFARSEQDPCNRLAACDDDNGDHDLYAQRSTDRGKHWSAPELVAANPHDALPFRGRTIAATITADRTIWLFWASGGNGSALHYLHRDPGTGQWSALGTLNDAYYFNVEAVSRGNDVFVYYEDGTGAGIFERTFDGTSFTAPALVAANRNIPKVIIDGAGVFRMAMVNASTWPVVDVETTSSTDGITWSAPDVAVPGDGATTNWDPTLTQLPNGAYLLFFAPDTGDGNQHIAVAASADFDNWSTPKAISNPSGFWDYWPEATTAQDGLTLYFTSEAGSPAGTGHIWSVTGKDYCKEGGAAALGFKNEGECRKAITSH